MDQAGYDLLVLEQLLALAHELDVVLPATEEDDLSSLRIARCIQAHIHQKRRAGMLACAAPTGMLDTRKDNEPAQAWASVNDTSWRADAPEACDSSIRLSHAEWGRLQVEDASLLKLRCRVMDARDGGDCRGVSQGAQAHLTWGSDYTDSFEDCQIQYVLRGLCVNPHASADHGQQLVANRGASRVLPPPPSPR
ncbi:unnamed protein product [Lampetra fluviatilis]